MNCGSGKCGYWPSGLGSQIPRPKPYRTIWEALGRATASHLPPLRTNQDLKREDTGIQSAMDYEDSHENISDAEPDSDHEDDAQKLLGTWLGELENLKL
ncbi:hypothetical protein AVEN_82050-1, partial [Araneus ventricosus]